MFLASFATGLWQANCYLAAVGAGRDCVIVDAGMEAADQVRELVAEYGLSPVAVLATHGHLDHVADAAKLADEYDAPLWLHEADRFMLTDPVAGLGPDSRTLVEALYPGPWREPTRLNCLVDGAELELAGLPFRALHAPGHSPGSTLLTVPYPGHDEIGQVVFSGDVLFAGSIGRTDLPGGDAEEMRRSLAGPVLGLPDDAAILPGHGPQSRMARERATNPYLQSAFLRN